MNSVTTIVFTNQNEVRLSSGSLRREWSRGGFPCSSVELQVAGAAFRVESFPLVLLETSSELDSRVNETFA